jgi:hypothetical protein
MERGRAMKHAIMVLFASVVVLIINISSQAQESSQKKLCVSKEAYVSLLSVRSDLQHASEVLVELTASETSKANIDSAVLLQLVALLDSLMQADSKIYPFLVGVGDPACARSEPRP